MDRKYQLGLRSSLWAFAVLAVFALAFTPGTEIAHRRLLALSFSRGFPGIFCHAHPRAHSASIFGHQLKIAQPIPEAVPAKIHSTALTVIPIRSANQRNTIMTGSPLRHHNMIWIAKHAAGIPQSSHGHRASDIGGGWSAFIAAPRQRP